VREKSEETILVSAGAERNIRNAVEGRSDTGYMMQDFVVSSVERHKMKD